MSFIKVLEKNELDDLIKQILKAESLEDKDQCIDKDLEEFEDWLDPLKDSDKKINDLTEETYDLFLQDNLQPESYKLNIKYGENVFEGYYESAMDELKKMKVGTYTTLSREIESENLQNALVVIKDKKENNIDTFLFDTNKRAQVDSYKWTNTVWWHVLYELQGKVVFFF